VSDGTPDPGELAIGEHLAGYRLDEIIARGGMAVVYRAYDERLGRSVALKVLAAPLARDEAFRRRFIRESRIAAAVDHPNILPVFEAGEADGVLFIATRLVPGRDVLSLLEEQGTLPAARVCHIVTQVAAALDAAHEQGLVHRDVKPANMLRDAAAGEAYPDHIYLADFGLSKHGRSASQLTSYGEFLGTMDYVSPEQIEGRPVEGQSDQYALACSAFEMLTGAPPFKRDETLAIMWAQVSSTPPAATSRRPELPEAVDTVLAKALAKVPGDRYGSCLEFATALRRACGLDGTTPGVTPPGPGQERADTAVWGAVPAAAAAATPEQAGAAPAVPEPAAPEPEPEPVTLGPGVVEPAAAEPVPPPAAPLPMTVLTPRAPSPPARRPPPAVPPGYRLPPGKEPRSRRSRVTVLVTCVALLGLIGGGYLVFGGSGPRTRPAAALALPGCTTKTATAATVRTVPQFPVPTGGKPFDVVVTAKGYGFVSLTTGLAVLRASGPRPAVIQSIPLASALGEALTHDQRYLLVAGQHGLRVFRVRDLVHGLSAPVGTLTGPGKHPVQVAVSPDDRFAFVTYQFSRAVDVFNLGKALTAGFSPGDLVGQVPVRSNPIGVAASPDGRYLYVASGLATPARESGMGSLSVIGLRKAETSPRAAVLQTVGAGCGPDRVVVSGDGQTVWVSAGGGNAVVAFSAAKLLTEPGAALEARVAVGQLPLGLAIVDQGARLIVADSNRDNLPGSAASLAVIDVGKALARKPALDGFVKAGGTPRQFALEPGGATLLVADTGAGRVQAVKIAQLP
jgi:DNA-binding beta-propeller fold protein YncE/tRNA A-37 threonylcarbamoyl transferase component Bud32